MLCSFLVIWFNSYPVSPGLALALCMLTLLVSFWLFPSVRYGHEPGLFVFSSEKFFFEVLTTLALAICNGHKEGDFVFRKEKKFRVAFHT